jgi:hypothetical protein
MLPACIIATETTRALLPHGVHAQHGQRLARISVPTVAPCLSRTRIIPSVTYLYSLKLAMSTSRPKETERDIE